MSLILQQLKEAISKYEVKIKVNEIPEKPLEEIVIDIEHDEDGGFVCLGLYSCSDIFTYVFTDLCIARKLMLHTSKIIGHNVVTDVELMQVWGININDSQIYWDTMLIGHLIDSSLKNYGLKAMAKREFNIEYPSYDDIVGKRTEKQKNPRITLDKQPQDIVINYNALDVYSTFKLYEKQAKLLGIPEMRQGQASTSQNL